MAQRQLDADYEEARITQIEPTGTQGSTQNRTSTSEDAAITTQGNGTGVGGVSPPIKTKKVRRFYGSVKVEPVRLTRDVGQLAAEVLQHLVGLVCADVQVTIEVQAQVPDGIPEDVVRTVSEKLSRSEV